MPFDNRWKVILAAHFFHNRRRIHAFCMSDGKIVEFTILEDEEANYPLFKTARL